MERGEREIKWFILSFGILRLYGETIGEEKEQRRNLFLDLYTHETYIIILNVS